MANIVPASERDLSSSIAKKVIVNGALGNLVSCWFYLFNAKIVILSRGPHLLLVAPSSMEYNSVIPGTPVYTKDLRCFLSYLPAMPTRNAMVLAQPERDKYCEDYYYYV